VSLVLKSLIAFVPASVLLVASAIVFIRRKDLSTTLQLLGASGGFVVVLAHLCEALHLFPWMNWGQEHSTGHYLDFFGAVVGLTTVPAGLFAPCAGTEAQLTHLAHLFSRALPLALICSKFSKGTALLNGTRCAIYLP
jgi:hypothetical protein